MALAVRAGRGGPAGWCVLLVALALLSAGCQARLALDVAVDGDGAGTLAVTLAADAALRAEARARGVDPLDDLVATGERLAGAGWRVQDRTGEDGGREVTLAASFAGPGEFEALAADLAAALAAPEVTLLEGLRLEVTDETVRFEAGAGLQPTAAVADLGLEPAEVVTLLATEEPLVYEVTVALAGEVLETTAADAGATPLRWEVRPGERVRVVAVAERPRSPLPLTAAAGALVVLLVLLAGRLALRRRRRRRRLQGLRARSGVPG